VRVRTSPGRRSCLPGALDVVAALTVFASVACGSVQGGTEHSPTAGPGVTKSAPRSPNVPSVTRGLTARRGHLSVTAEPWRLPQPVAREAVAGSGRRVVVAGGLVGGDRSTPSTYRLDLLTGRVQTMPDLPVAVHDVAGSLNHGRPLVVGGGNTTEQSVVQSWRTGGDWTVSGRLPSPRSDLVSLTVNGRVIVIGGYDATTPAVADILVSRNRHRWAVLGRLRVPVRYAAAAVADSAIWVFGGERSGVMVDAVQRVDLRTGHVQVLARLPHPLGHAAAIAVGRRVLVIGGRTSSALVTARMWWFDPSRKDFHRAGRLPSPLADTATVTVGTRAYLIGGETPRLSNRVLCVILR
jgi:hypothetical protein